MKLSFCEFSWKTVFLKFCVCGKQFIFPEFEDNPSFKFRGIFFFFGETEWKLSVYVLRNDEKSFFQDTFFFKKHTKLFSGKTFSRWKPGGEFFFYSCYMQRNHFIFTRWKQNEESGFGSFFLEKIFLFFPLWNKQVQENRVSNKMNYFAPNFVDFFFLCENTAEYFFWREIM